MERNPVEAGLLPRPNLLEHGCGVGAARNALGRHLDGDALGDGVEVGRPRQLLVDRAAEPAVPPEPEDGLLRLLLARGPAEPDLAVARPLAAGTAVLLHRLLVRLGRDEAVADATRQLGREWLGRGDDDRDRVLG